MFQTATEPSLARHNTSLLPSPLKSPTPLICQLLGIDAAASAEKWVESCIDQTATVPSLLRHSTSSVMSPLKSPLKPFETRDKVLLSNCSRSIELNESIPSGPLTVPEVP